MLKGTLTGQNQPYPQSLPQEKGRLLAVDRSGPWDSAKRHLGPHHDIAQQVEVCVLSESMAFQYPGPLN